MEFEVKELKDCSKRLRTLHQKAEEALGQKNIGYAMELFREFLRKEPGVLEVRQRLREVQYSNNNNQTKLWSQLLVSTLSLPQMFINQILLKSEDAAKGIKALDSAERLLTLDPTAYIPLIMLDYAGHETGLPEVCVQTLEWAVQFHPKSIFMWNRLGQAYSACGMGTKCLNVYRRLQELAPNNKRWAEAVKDATAEAAMEAGGWTQVEQGEADYHALIRDKEEAARLEQAGHTMRTEEGIKQLIEGALLELEEQDTVENRRKLAELYAEGRMYDQALEQYEVVVEMSGISDPAIEQAIMTIQIRRWDEQIRDMEERMNNEELADEERQAAEAEAERLRQEKADALLGSMRQRVKRYPNQHEDRFELAKMLLDKGEIDEALPHLQRLQGLPQVSIPATLFLGRCFYAKHVYDLAVEQFQKVIDSIRNMTQLKKEAYYDLAKTYEAMDRHDEAIVCYKAIYSVDLHFRDVGEIIDRLYQQQS